MKVVNIKDTAEKLKPVIIRNLLFIHAWGGCDTTSATFGQGKNKILGFVEKDTVETRKICSVFDKANASQEEIGAAGIELFGLLYGKIPNFRGANFDG